MDLQERVDPREEEDGLDDDRLLLLRRSRVPSVSARPEQRAWKGRNRAQITYMAATHEGDDDGGDEDGGAEHDQVVLEAQEYRRDCTTEIKPRVRASHHEPLLNSSGNQIK